MITKISNKVIAELAASSSYKERFIAEYIQLKQRHEKLKVFNSKIEAAGEMAFRAGADKVPMPKHDCPEELLRRQQHVMGEYLHILELRAVIEEIDLQDAIEHLIKKALWSEAECEGVARECKTAEEIEREKTCCQRDCVPPCEEGIYDPPEEDLPEGILSLEETLKVYERCVFPREGKDSCSDCIIRDHGCGDMVRDKSVLYHLKKYVEHK